MKLSEKERTELRALMADYIHDSHVQEMKQFIQHGDVTTFQHVLNVTKNCFWLNRRLHLGADENRLVAGALLHDFYLYDWHNRPVKDWTHSYKHPMKAAENAVRYFDADDVMRRMIECHMWPLTFWRTPNCREAWILVAADKYVSLEETLFHRKGRKQA